MGGAAQALLVRPRPTRPRRGPGDRWPVRARAAYRRRRGCAEAPPSVNVRRASPSLPWRRRGPARAQNGEPAASEIEQRVQIGNAMPRRAARSRRRGRYAGSWRRKRCPPTASPSAPATRSARASSGRRLAERAGCPKGRADQEPGRGRARGALRVRIARARRMLVFFGDHAGRARPERSRGSADSASRSCSSQARPG